MYISFKKESCTDTEKNLFTMKAVNYKYNIYNGVLRKKRGFHRVEQVPSNTKLKQELAFSTKECRQCL